VRPKARRRAFLTLWIRFYENAARIIGKASYENQYFFGRADNLPTIQREEESWRERKRPAVPNERVSNANNSHSSLFALMKTAEPVSKRKISLFKSTSWEGAER
jgi:hypothetical protein